MGSDSRSSARLDPSGCAGNDRFQGGPETEPFVKRIGQAGRSRGTSGFALGARITGLIVAATFTMIVAGRFGKHENSSSEMDLGTSGP